jgi:cytochrome c-type biogenesis protein
MAAARRQAPGRAEENLSVVFYVNEITHIDDLPAQSARPLLQVGTGTYEPVEALVMADSPHHRASTVIYDAEGLDLSSGMSLLFPAVDGEEATNNVLSWDLPIQYTNEYASPDVMLGGEDATIYTPTVTGVAVLAALGGLLAAMWPCLFQLTAYFIPAMAGMSMNEASSASGLKPRGDVARVAFFFVLGFTIVYTLAGAVIGYGSQQLSGMDSFYSWQRYLSIGAGVILLGMALRIAVKARAPLICKMPIARKVAGNGRTSPWESMIVGVAFATGCMTCFGSAVLIGMVLYVGIAGLPLVGATLLFLFSLGMGIPLVLGALAMARVLPMLFKMEKAIPWMGLGSAILIAGYALILITGNFMVVSSWFVRMVGIEGGPF